jgi:exonuclease SbcC
VRILAIRARNLASIEKFELELSSGPLAETRIFAITGPTGAGKSTLLDAMCLALYDHAPRLIGSNKSTGAELEISAVDPRSLVRRGASEASAEVDFEADSGGKWRAIWEVWRARKRIDGRLQSQRMRLVSLGDGREHTGATKTETLEKISTLIGLGYGEFRRAVLLAQNDFASFLKAKPDERAELLEKMTGTELYAAISRNAFLRAKKEEENLRVLDGERKRISPLDEDRRAELSREREQLQTQRVALESELALWARAIEWHQALLRTEKEVVDGERELNTSREARAASEPLAAELARTRLAERLRPAFEGAERAAKTYAELLAAAKLALVKAERAKRERTEAEALLIAAQEASRTAAERALQLKPELEKARAFDVQLAEAVRALEEAAKEKRRAENALKKAGEAHAKNESLAAELALRLERLSSSVKAMARVETIAAQWPRWRAEIDRYLSLETVAPKLSLEEITHLYTRAIEEEAAARTETNEARRALDERRRLDPPRVLFEATERLGLELSSLSRLGELAVDTKAAERERAEEEKKLRDSLDLHDKLSPEISALDAQFDALELAEKRDSLLAHGAECPLCGSTEHPAAGAPVPDRTALTEELHGKKLLAARAKETAALAKERAAHLSQQITKAAVEWNERRRAIEMLWVDSPILGRLGSNRVAMRLPFQPEAKTAAKDVAAAAKTLEEHRRALVESISVDEAKVGALDQLRAKAEDAETRAEALKLALRAKELVELLRAPLSSWTGWEEQLTTAPLKLRDQLAQEVAAWETLGKERAAVEEQQRKMALEREGTAAEQKTAAETASRAASIYAEQELRRDLLVAARKVVLKGAPAQQVEAELSRAMAEAENKLLSARTSMAASGELFAKREADRASLEARAAEEGSTVELQAKRLEKEMAASGIEERTELVALLAHGPSWIDESERAIHEARDAVGRAESKLAERRRKLEEHRARMPEIDARDLERAAERIEVLKKKLETMIERSSRITAELAADEHARFELARLDGEIDKQRVIVDRWGEMNSLIGSADGKKLRTFAQGLTLDSLLLQANFHLQELRPRYRLRRLEGTDLELEVIDGDMGDEIRAISTLSGGESFLVSLALALALSSIAAHDVHIRSLFIDEGFGSLDPEAMEVALATLDRLQAEGRTIGIISHVPQIAERIGYRVHVQPIGPGRSEVIVMST